MYGAISVYLKLCIPCFALAKAKCSPIAKSYAKLQINLLQPVFSAWVYRGIIFTRSNKSFLALWIVVSHETTGNLYQSLHLDTSISQTLTMAIKQVSHDQ